MPVADRRPGMVIPPVACDIGSDAESATTPVELCAHCPRVLGT